MLADVQLLDREVAPQVHDDVHDLGQDHGVDDVALEHDLGPVDGRAHRGVGMLSSTRLIACRMSSATRAGWSA